MFSTAVLNPPAIHDLRANPLRLLPHAEAYASTTAGGSSSCAQSLPPSKAAQFQISRAASSRLPQLECALVSPSGQQVAMRMVGYPYGYLLSTLQRDANMGSFAVPKKSVSGTDNLQKGGRGPLRSLEKVLDMPSTQRSPQMLHKI